MLKTCSDQVCSQIVNLVEKQIENVEERGYSVKVMIVSLVISFHAATHWSRLYSLSGDSARAITSIEDWKQRDIQVLQNDGA